MVSQCHVNNLMESGSIKIESGFVSMKMVIRFQMAFLHACVDLRIWNLDKSKIMQRSVSLDVQQISHYDVPNDLHNEELVLLFLTIFNFNFLLNKNYQQKKYQKKRKKDNNNY